MAQKGIPVAPLTGLLDLRSQPDLLAPGSLRMRQNFQTFNQKTIGRGSGWSKLFSSSLYNNADFHDQLLVFGGSAREPITMLAEVESSNKARWLFLATQSRIAKLNQFTGNWQILGTGFGGGTGVDLSGPRFQCSVLGDYVTLTNGTDVPMSYVMDALFTADQLLTGLFSDPNGHVTPPNVTDSAQYFQESTSPLVIWNWDTVNENWFVSNNLLSPIADLALIGVTTARKTWMWRNCIFLADCTVDGSRKSYRIYWSDYNAPISFDPAVQGSITGFIDLDYGETILGGKECGGSFLIYTDRGIWELYVLNTSQPASTSNTTASVFGVQKLPGTEKNSCLKYENTLVNIGDGHLYMGTDRIYFYNQFLPKPDEVEWIHSADSVLFDDIVAEMCQAHVACIHGNEVYVSVLTTNSTNGCPDVTLRINKLYKTVDIVDSGFTALCDYRPQPIPTIRDFIIDQSICSPTGMTEYGYGWTNEGLPNPMPNPSAPFTPTCIYTHVVQFVDGIETEDWNQPNPAPDSLCALLAAEGFNTLLGYCEKCDSVPSLVGAHSTDWCLKEIGTVFYRERCTNPMAAGSTGTLGYTSSMGSYILDPYNSIIRFAPIFSPNQLSRIQKILLNFLTVFIFGLFLLAPMTSTAQAVLKSWPATKYMGTNFFPITNSQQFAQVLLAMGFINGEFVVTAGAINASQIQPLNLPNTLNIISGTFTGPLNGTSTNAVWSQNSLASISSQSLSFQDGGIFTANGWSFTQGAGGNVPDIWLTAYQSNQVASVFQFSPEGAVMDYAGFCDTLNGGGNTAFFDNVFHFPVFANNSSNQIQGIFTNGVFYGDGTGIFNVTAVHYSGVLPTNNLPAATTTRIGAVIPDGTTITVDPNGKITAITSGGPGGSVTNIYFLASSTIGFTVLNGTNYQFFVNTASVTSNLISGQINAGQISGALTTVTASSPLASSGGTAPNITVNSSTGGGSIVESNAPTISNPTILGTVAGTPTINLANATNFQCIQGLTVQGGNSFSVVFTHNALGGTNAVVTVNTNVPTSTATNMVNGCVAIGGGWQFTLDSINTFWITNTLAGAFPSFGYYTNGQFAVGTPGSATLVLGIQTNNTPAGTFANGSFLSTTNGHYYGVQGGNVVQIF